MSIRVVVFGVLFAFLNAAFPPLGHSQQNCPLKDSKESLADCPWASIVRESAPIPDQFYSILKKQAPRVAWDIQSDALEDEIKGLWGYAVNYDEYAKAEIIAQKTDSTLTELFKVPLPAPIPTHPGRFYLHSGIQHTYGYLFSNLETPYGYKRARWVAGTIEKGLGLSPGIVSAAPQKGSLFTNVSLLAAKIVGMKIPKSLNRLAAKEIKRFKVLSSSKITLIESASFPRNAVFQTDFYRFQDPAQGALLIYSVRDAAEKNLKLVTVFPVDAAFVDRALKSETGKDLSLQLRYNAYLPGLYGNTEIRGSRILRHEKK